MADKIQFYPLDLTYKIVDNKPLIYIYGKTTNEEQICVIDDSFEPYFYVLLRDEDDLDEFCKKAVKIKIEDKDRESVITKTESEIILILFIPLDRWDDKNPKLNVGNPAPGYNDMLNKFFFVSMGDACSP